MDERPNYYAIIPASVRYDKRLPSKAPLLYGEITALCNKKGMCWASDDYFMNLYSVSKSTIQLWLSSLVKNGYIEREVVFKKGSKEIEKRYIRISDKVYREIGIPYTEKSEYPIPKNKTDNNTSINNTLNNTSNKIHSPAEAEPCIPYQEIIDYLNQKAGTKYRNTKTNQRIIEPRFKEGFELADFKKAIDVCVTNWKNDGEMNKYLRPSTIFRASKFEGYVNAKPSKGRTRYNHFEGENDRNSYEVPF